MLTLLLSILGASAGGTYVVVADPADWADPTVGDRLRRTLGPAVVIGPASDLAQPGRTRADQEPSAQSGRVSDQELRQLGARLERARDADDCAAQLAVADQVHFVDRRTVRELRFAALVGAGVCAADQELDGPEWITDIAGERVSAPLAHALALASRDAALFGRVEPDVRALLDAAQLALRGAPVRELEVVGPHEIWIDGVPTEPDPDTGAIALVWGRADIQLVRSSGGVATWSSSVRVEPGDAPVQPLALAEQEARALVAELATDGGARFARSVGAFTGLVGADALYLAIPDKRRLVLWRWIPGEARFVTVRGADVL